MNTISGTAWHRKGITLAWELPPGVEPHGVGEVTSLRQFLRLQAIGWPDELPSSRGRAVVVTGLESTLDSLSFDDAEAYLANTVAPAIIAFQHAYQRSAAVIFSMPSGGSRARLATTNDSCEWRHGGTSADQWLAIGRLLFAGASTGAAVIEATDGRRRDLGVGQGIYLAAVS